MKWMVFFDTNYENNKNFDLRASDLTTLNWNILIVNFIQK